MRLVALLALAGCLPLAAQQNWCSDRGWHNDGMVTHNEVREEHLAAAAQNVINPAQNGSIHVHAWANSDILVKACVQATAQDEASGAALAKQVTITDGPGRIVAKGPETQGSNTWWSVSYDVWMPASANLDLHAFNGSIHVEATTGQLRAQTLNGSLTLTNVSGDVDAETTNGSVTINLAEGTSSGKGMKLKTVNGSIHLQLPSTFGADVEASTVHGRVKNDFAESTPEDKELRTQRFTIGAGGTKIEAETVNGSVHISKQS
jgi:hypothetical protein